MTSLLSSTDGLVGESSFHNPRAHAILRLQQITSMGPRLFRRGNVCGWGTPLPPGNASMGPRLFRRGNVNFAFRIIIIVWLQWGHVFSDVETFFYAINFIISFMLQWGHVFSDVETVGRGAKPLEFFELQWGHVFSDVETYSEEMVMSGVEMLQWGHVFSDVETEYGGGVRKCMAKLQWGHVFSDVETIEKTAEEAQRDRASMGPRLFRRGNCRRCRC